MKSELCFQAAAVIAVAIVATACAAGTGLIKRPDASFELGKTTEPEIRERYGSPRPGLNRRGERTFISHGRTIKVLHYVYSEFTPFVEKVPSRVLICYFSEGTLIGFDYSSSFSDDKTDFDESLVGGIRPDETTQADVVALLGQPTGRFIYPASVVKTPDQQAYVYSYGRTDVPLAWRVNPFDLGPMFTIRAKTLIILFNGGGVVVETNLIESRGER